MTTQVTGSGVNFNGSTSGTILLTQPAIAGTNTITLPAETGTLRSTVSSGTVLQVVNYQTGAVAPGTTTIPADNSIPQNTEGDQYMSLAITPRSATSTLIISVVWSGGNTAAASVVSAALFQDSTANALATMWSQHSPGYPAFVGFSHKMTSGTTSSTTFKVRGGCNVAGTTSFNGVNSGNGYYGGVLASSITITEVVP